MLQWAVDRIGGNNAVGIAPEQIYQAFCKVAVYLF